MRKMFYVGKDVKSKRERIQELQHLYATEVDKEMKLLLVHELVPLGVFLA
jgi:hypothetical protein